MSKSLNFDQIRVTAFWLCRAVHSSAPLWHKDDISKTNWKKHALRRHEGRQRRYRTGLNNSKITHTAHQQCVQRPCGKWKESPIRFRGDFIYPRLICLPLNVDRAFGIYTHINERTHRQALKATAGLQLGKPASLLFCLLDVADADKKHPQPLLPSAHPACLFTNSTKQRENKNSKTKQSSCRSLFCHCPRSHGGGSWIIYLTWLTQSQILMKSLFMDYWATCKQNHHLLASAPCLIFRIRLPKKPPRPWNT